eukprot:TsM_000150100 transcript=TsM_000150100 gene=TsM_000150100
MAFQRSENVLEVAALAFSSPGETLIIANITYPLYLQHHEFEVTLASDLLALPLRQISCRAPSRIGPATYLPGMLLFNSVRIKSFKGVFHQRSEKGGALVSKVYVNEHD